ncbi:MAG: TrkH family potassium uptake protein [Deltaproteobacteria bacterium]|nr:TrkH family potassium uptake protein [Deltaproteobacteria bacterium]
MNFRAVTYTLAHLAIIVGLCLIAPLVVSIIYFGDHPSGVWIWEIVGFSIPMALCLGAGLFFHHRYQSHSELGRREGFAVVTFSWLLLTLVGMMPYLISGATASVTDAFFETMSGFTTTGASVFPSVEIIPHGVQFWRCMTQWMGGMGIVVLSVALLSFLGVGGYRLLKAETPGGVTFEREKPRIAETAKNLWKLYVLISAAELILLKLSGMTLYDAFCHTFTTMSTGGFSNHSESINYFTNPWTQWIIIFFMFAAGVNFSLYTQLFRLRPRPMLRNPEFRLYAAITAVVVLAGVFIVPMNGKGVEHHVRDIVFTAVSIGTTTGYATADYDQWPQLMRLIMLLLMFVGGSMGSTGGGMKVARILVYAKASARELHRLIYPNAIRPIRVGEKVLDPKIVSNIMAFGSIFAALFVFGTIVMVACGYDLVSSASASVAALSNIGPGLGVFGPSNNWAHLPDVAKWIMSLLMLLGRLELFSVLILCTSWAWRR